MAASIIEVIGKEIKWCIEHPDDNLSADYRKGFVNGLIQARYLVGAIHTAEISETE